MYHPVFRVPDSTAAPSFCKGSIHELQILRMDEASSFADRPGQRVVAMNERGTRIAFEATGRNVHVERTEVGATQRQLELLVAHFQRGLVAISFGEQGREDQDDQCAGHGERLRSEDAIRNGQAHVCEVPDGKSCRPDYGQGYDECRSGREHRPAAHRNPKQDGKHDADGQGGGPGLLRQRNQEHVEDSQRRQACRPLDQLATCRRVAQGCTQANHERGDRDRSQQARHEPDLPHIDGGRREGGEADSHDNPQGGEGRPRRARHDEPQHLPHVIQLERTTEPVLEEPRREHGLAGADDGERDCEPGVAGEDELGGYGCDRHGRHHWHARLGPERDQRTDRNASRRPEDSYIARLGAEDQAQASSEEIGGADRDDDCEPSTPRLGVERKIYPLALVRPNL